MRISYLFNSSLPSSNPGSIQVANMCSAMTLRGISAGPLLVPRPAAVFLELISAFTIMGVHIKLYFVWVLQSAGPRGIRRPSACGVLSGGMGGKWLDVDFCTFLLIFVYFCTFLYIFVHFCTFQKHTRIGPELSSNNSFGVFFEKIWKFQKFWKKSENFWNFQKFWCSFLLKSGEF